jgi:aminoglycoside phosphotransferase
MEGRYVGMPEYDPDDDVFFIFLEYQHRMFRVQLLSDLVCPALTDLPNLPAGYKLEEVDVTTEMSEVLRSWTVLTSGSVHFLCHGHGTSNLKLNSSDATIRVSESEPDHILKCALPSFRSRARVAYEYRMLKEIEQHPVPLPVVRTISDALEDKDGVFAFRLERLQEWNSSTDPARAIRDVTEKLHGQGFCHNDLRVPNLMRNENFPILIDFDRAGPVGGRIPSYLNFRDGNFSVTEDLAAMRFLKEI